VSQVTLAHTAAVWTQLVVGAFPLFDLLPGVLQVQEEMSVEAFLSESVVEAFDVGGPFAELNGQR
jgi:hypothetical protein